MTYRSASGQVGASAAGSAADGPTVYAAWPGEHPVFSGGRAIREIEAGGGGLWRARMADYASGIVLRDCEVSHTGTYGEWMRIELDAGHGTQAQDTWRLTATRPNGQ